VRITWKDSNPKPSNQAGATIFRGQVVHVDYQGLWLEGRFFVEKADTQTLREIPRDKEEEPRLYYGPWTSLDEILIIPEGSKDFEVHQVVLARKFEHHNGG
jgi:hypothetical protein